MLTFVVDENGCATWRGLARGQITCPGDAQRDLMNEPTACIAEGEARLTAAGKAIALRGKTTAKASAPTRTRFHVWKCPHARNVRAPLSEDLTGIGCTLLGNDVDPGEQRGADIACAYSKNFDALDEVTLTVEADGSLRIPITIAEKGSIVLHRLDETTGAKP